MKVVAAKTEIPAPPDTAVETLLLSPAQLEFLGRVTRNLNPHMPMAFGVPHVVRMLLERLEESGVDLTDATSEEELTRIGAGSLRRQDERRRVQT